MSLISKNSAVPVYAMTRPGGQKGVLAGPPGGATGARYAIVLKMIERVLAGEKASSIPIRHFPGATVFAFDESQFSRWGIDPGRVPPGSLVVNQQRSLWNKYREVILAMAAFIILESVLTGFLLVQRRRRRKAEALLADRNARLEQSESSLRQLNGELITAQEEERRRIARELHDDLNQQVADLGISLSGIRREVPVYMEGMRGDIASVQKRLMTLSDGLRQISHELHPGMLELFGLVATLRAHCREFSGIASFPIEFETNCNEMLPMHVSLCLYRIAQEAIRNASKHSGANKVRVFLRRAGSEIRLVVSDDGIGFDAEEALRRGGLGVRSMEERVRLIGGEFELISHPGEGTTLIVSAILSETTKTPKPKATTAAAR
jgi:signal transduction histidine kinase